jgi:hypothetical protein
MPIIQGRPPRSPITLADDFDGAIDGVTLGDAAEVDSHAAVQEANPVFCELDMAIIDRRQFRRHRRLVGLLAFSVVVSVADAGVADIEGAVGNS